MNEVAVIVAVAVTKLAVTCVSISSCHSDNYFKFPPPDSSSFV